MELSWSTFLLEIINFLVLIWILKRFFFNPVREIIARRRARIDQRIKDAEALQAEALTLKQQYRERLADWEAEKQRLRIVLAEALEEEKAKRLSALASQIEQDKERSRVAERRQQEDLRRGMEETAMGQAAAFAGRLLQSAAGQDTETRLVQLVITELEALPRERIESFQSASINSAEIRVVSAFPLSDRLRQKLKASLARIFSAAQPLYFEQDASLLAGIRIATGNWVLGCNLKDELAGFAELDHVP